jgi:hypothetical protein
MMIDKLANQVQWNFEVENSIHLALRSLHEAHANVVLIELH